MSRTYRKHLSLTGLAKRGGTPPKAKHPRASNPKSHKQQRPNERAKLRKEYL